jgi:ribonucleoside-diphosphate reductase alpha chain
MEKREFEKWYWLNDRSVEFLENGYIKGDIKEHFKKIGDKAEALLGKEGWSEKFLDYVARGWYLLPTPGVTNFIHPKESAISCFGSYCEDSVEGLLMTDAEIGMLSKIGGGTSVCLTPVRAEGEPITGGGFADGPMRMVKRVQDTTSWISQRSRRGKVATYLSVRHKDIGKYLTIKDKTSDIHEVPFGVVIDSAWVRELKEGDVEKRDIWAKIIKKKFETGYPYILFEDNANDNTVDVYKDKKMKINNSNLCTEILLFNDHFNTFVCCIGAMNLVHYDEWKDTDAVEILLNLLDTFLLDFIDKNKDNPLMKRAVNFAEQQMAVGIGASGYHSYLQMNDIAIESMDAKMLNVEIFRKLKDMSYAASEKMATEYGKAPLLAEDKYTRRHVTLNAIAPNLSSSEIFGQWSNSIEPNYSNYYIKALAKNKYAHKNPLLEEVLERIGNNTQEVWDSIKNNNGSVQHLHFLSDHQKLVFKTSFEISPMELLLQNAARTKHIDQGISFNTMIPFGTPAKEVSDFYLKAHELGIKTLYYQLNQNAAQQLTRKSIMECEACAG